MRRFSTEEIAEITGGVASGHAIIDNIATDNRVAREGSLFIAIVGERLDGHEFIPAAVEAGASAVLCHKPIETTVPTILVKDTTQALLDLGRAYRLEHDIPYVGLTGSVGKTTTKEMIWCVLNAKFTAYKTAGNFNNQIGLPKVLLAMGPEYNAAVIEMGMNHKGEISNLSKATVPDVGVITNVGVSHIENLGSREGILAAKLEILDGMKPGATLILNKDNDMLKTVVNDNYNLKFFSVEDESAYVHAKDITYGDASTTFTAVTPVGSAEVVIPTTGVHNVYNALAAICVGLEYDIPLADMAVALGNYKPAGMRENIVEKGGVTVIEDCYNASPDSMKALAETLKLKGALGRRKIAVIGDMLELGDYSEEAHRRAGMYMAEAGIDLLITYGKASKFAADEARERGLLRVFNFEDKDMLAEKLIDMVKPGDVVAFKASRGMYLEEVITKLYESLKD